MLDQLQKALLYKPQDVSPDAFHDWKQNPVTQELLASISESYLSTCADGLPTDPSLACAISQQREGCRSLIDSIFNWEPVNVSRIKAGDGDDE